MPIQPFFAQDARKNMNTSIIGSENEESSLEHILEQIERASLLKKSILHYRVLDMDGNPYHCGRGYYFPLEYVVNKLKLMGYSVEINGQYLIVNWQ